MIRAALAYARRGHRVLPLRERGKEPLLAHGVHDASADEQTVRAWWTRWPQANVAIAVPPGWFVIDIDPRNDGEASLEQLEVVHDALPVTVTARTGSGGTHLLFERPDGLRLRGKLGRGVDVLGTGRYFVCAPSIHPSGGRYAWTSARGTAIAAPPAWLVALLRVPEMPPPAPRASGVSSGGSLRDRARKYLAACPAAISGAGGHVTTFRVAQVLVRGFELAEDDALDLLAEWNQRCEPPWSRRELQHKVRQAIEHGRLPIGCLLGRRGAA